MDDKIPENENHAEKIPNEREILNLFAEIIDHEDFEILRSLEDDSGLYLLEVQTRGEDGEIELLQYYRSGVYPEGKTLESTIKVVFYVDDVPVSAKNLSKFEGGEWVTIQSKD